MNETTTLNSIRMRAERHGKHISGAERLVPPDQLESTAMEMVARALRHPRGQAEQINIRIDEVEPGKLQFGSLPDLHDNRVKSWQQGRLLARDYLLTNSVSQLAADKAMQYMANGAAPDGQSMRGAMLIDADSGERLEADQARGVRASRMDLCPQARQQLRALLTEHGLDNMHVIEALTLATKVINAPRVVAELCWSDDPDYVAGYVASLKTGYQRINMMKPAGEERGGRSFFVRGGKDELAKLVDWLQNQPFLVDRIGRILPPRFWEGDL